MPEALLFLLFVPLLVALWALRRRSTTDLMRRSGQRGDGTWEPGRAPSDMTLVGKVASAVGLAAVLVVVVLRITDGGEGWMWAAAFGVGAVCVATVIISERRRVRREGVDVGYGLAASAPTADHPVRTVSSRTRTRGPVGVDSGRQSL